MITVSSLKSMVQNTLALLHDRRLAYRLTFPDQSKPAQEVLADLTKFCHWGSTPFNPDPNVTLVIIGRQQVLLRIKQHLNLSDEQLFALYNGQSVPRRAEQEEEYDG